MAIAGGGRLTLVVKAILLMDELFWATSKFTGEEYTRGTACTSVKQAKSEAKIACANARSNGIVDPKVSFWRQIGNKLVQTKFTPDNKIKQIHNPIVLKDKAVFEPYTPQ